MEEKGQQTKSEPLQRITDNMEEGRGEMGHGKEQMGKVTNNSGFLGGTIIAQYRGVDWEKLEGLRCQKTKKKRKEPQGLKVEKLQEIHSGA